MSGELARAGDVGIVDWQPKIDLIKRTVANGATDDELELFFHQARRAGLDPLAKQIYFVKRKGKGTIQVGIDGLRLIADRTGKYAGSEDAAFEGFAGNSGYPAQATVTVFKMVDGIRCPFTATARWGEYYPGDDQGFQWRKMPHAMLGKCAEALALRKAFPADMSGLYIHEEMEQADSDPAPLRNARDVTVQPQQSGVRVIPPDPAPAPREPTMTEARAVVREADGVPTAAKEGVKIAFGYTPRQWPLPKMWREDPTPKQTDTLADKAEKREVAGDNFPAFCRAVLDAYGLEGVEECKACTSLLIDFLMNADEDSIDAACAAACGESPSEPAGSVDCEERTFFATACRTMGWPMWADDERACRIVYNQILGFLPSGEADLKEGDWRKLRSWVELAVLDPLKEPAEFKKYRLYRGLGGTK